MNQELKKEIMKQVFPKIYKFSRNVAKLYDMIKYPWSDEAGFSYIPNEAQIENKLEYLLNMIDFNENHVHLSSGGLNIEYFRDMPGVGSFVDLYVTLPYDVLEDIR